MRRAYVLSLSLVLLVGIAGRGEASTITIFPFYSASGNYCPDGFGGIPPPPSCVSFSQSGYYSPVGFTHPSPPPGGNYSVGAGGTINPDGSGFLNSGVSVIFGFGGGQASARMAFNISEPSQIDLTCSASAFGFGTGWSGLTNRTTGQSLLSCFASFQPPVMKSGSFLLNNTDTYELFTQAILNTNDAVSGRLNFNIAGVTDVNVVVPDQASALYLLGIGLTSLVLVRNGFRAVWQRD